MYSPKISEALIPRIYRAAKEAKIPMTRWVNRVVERALPQTPGTREESGIDDSVLSRIPEQESVDQSSGLAVVK